MFEVVEVQVYHRKAQASSLFSLLQGGSLAAFTSTHPHSRLLPLTFICSFDMTIS